MRRNSDKDIALDGALEQARISRERDDKGMCVDCGTNPQNPQLSKPYCLSCWTSATISCSESECHGEATVDVSGRIMCDVHATQYAHELYADYVLAKCKAERLQEELFELKFQMKYNAEMDPSDSKTILAKETELELVAHNMMEYKEAIHHIQDSVEQVFPDDFSPSL
jgi:hypothetical protein